MNNSSKSTAHEQWVFAIKISKFLEICYTLDKSFTSLMVLSPN